MFSNEAFGRLRESIQGEFDVTVHFYDDQGSIIIDRRDGLYTAAPLDISALDDSVITITDNTEVFGYIKCEDAISPDVASAIRMFVKATLGLGWKNFHGDRVTREETFLVTRMLSDKAGDFYNDIVTYGANLGYKLEHPMGMIVTSLETNYNYYLNMSLGYESASDDAKYAILKQLKEHKYMNKQDIVAFVQNNCLVLMKAIEDLSDIQRLYQMMDKISEMISDILKTYNIFRYYIAPSEIVERFDTASRVYKEALDYISFAQKMNLDHPIITQDDVLYYSIASHLPTKVRVEAVEPKVKMLLSLNREVVEGLIQCFDAYIDNGFNIASTADSVYLHRNTVKKRMDRLYHLTGFDPSGDFKDIVMNKLILQQYLMESRGQ